MDFPKFREIIQFDSAGWIAGSSLLLCGLSGILLSIPYDFTRAYSSIFELILFNPAGSFVRNLHYWSAQSFLVFTLLHICDHLAKSTESISKSKRIWWILSFAMLILGYEMISGFILKGDAAGLQARRVLAALLESVPLVGKMLSSALTGHEENWLIVYVQHVGTGTILLFMGVYEHLRPFWPRMKSMLVVFSGIVLISFVFRAPLGLPDDTGLKGPWFFLAIQEMLHWTSHPIYLILSFLALFLLFGYLPRFEERVRPAIKWFFLTGGILYLLVTLLVFFFRSESWQWNVTSETVTTEEPILIFAPVNFLGQLPHNTLPENLKKESCLFCHRSMKGLSDSHNPVTTGCFVCHRGDPFSYSKQLAHKKMIRVPGNFSNLMQTCGTQNCHKEIAERLLGSPMSRLNGIVAVDRFVFGETTTPDDTLPMNGIGHSAADTHLRNLCSGCHTGNEKRQTGSAVWLERGGGCNACHLAYDEKALNSLKRMQSIPSQSGEEIHPDINVGVTNERCKSCHSRSGRVALNYEGWNETSLKKSEINDSVHFRILPDDRVLGFVQSDVHHQKGMACIDCHGSYELMGDGKHYLHKEDAVNVQCIDCHPLNKPATMAIGNLPDRESQLIAGLRKYDPKTWVVVTAINNRPLLNTRVDSLNRIFLTSKLTGEILESKRMSPVCSKGKGHSRLSCESCHSAWVPQCIGCHSDYEMSVTGVDMLTKKPTAGSWIEYAGKSHAEPPVLGVNGKDEGKIVTVLPGMILTIDGESFAKGTGKTFCRLYAPVSGHTTQREARSCKSCHNNPLAIGYGRGVLVYRPTGPAGEWIFTPRFAPNENDQLPEDAWTGFLREAKLPWSTRAGLRPFTVKEQLRILKVGSCLTCHDEKSKVMDWALTNFQQTLDKRSPKCPKD